MMLKDNFGTVDPIIGCQIPRIIVCLNDEQVKISSQNISKLLDHCEKHLKDRYQGCFITVLSTSPNDLCLKDFEFNHEKLIIKVDLYNIFNIVNSHFYNEHQVSIEIAAAIKRFDPLSLTADQKPIDTVNDKLSKMLVISNIINEACENKIFKDGESFSCLDLKGNPIIVDAISNHTLVLGYSVFDANGNILCTVNDDISLNDFYAFFNEINNFQNDVESYYCRFMSSKMINFLKGNNNVSFADCRDPQYAQEVCINLIENYKEKLLSIIPIESFSSNNNFESYFYLMFSNSIDISVKEFNSEMQDYCRLRD